MKNKCLSGIIIFLFFNLMYTASAQSVESRVSTIRKMYAEVQGILKNTSSIKCLNGKTVTYESLNEESDKIKFDQIATKCDLPKGYQYYKGEFTGYEWYSKYYIYLLNNKPFFVLIEFGGEGCTINSRLYYNEEGKIIKYLESKENCEEGNGTKDIKDKKHFEALEKDIFENIVKIQGMIKKKQ